MVNRLHAKTSQIGQILTNLERERCTNKQGGSNKEAQKIAQLRANLNIPPFRPKDLPTPQSPEGPPIELQSPKQSSASVSASSEPNS
jgi:hypothetical protein